MTKNTSLSLFLFSFAGLLIFGCSNNNSDTSGKTNKDSIATFNIVEMRKIIDEKNTVFAKAFVSGDSATVVNSYTKDAKLFPPNSDRVEGKDSIAAVISQFLKYGIKEFKDETTALYGNEDNLIEEGNFFMGDGKGKTIDKGKYITVWRKEYGTWKIYSDIWNTRIPSTPAKK